MPAFLFSRKQKSIQIFFRLLHNFTEQDLSIEKLYYYFDNDNHFQDIKTLRKYFNSFISQLNQILTSLNSQIISLKGDSEIENIFPGDDKLNKKLRMLFRMIDELIELLQQKETKKIILEGEKYFCLHWFLFEKSNFFLLRSHTFP